MWEINSNFQVLSFLYSLCLGGIFSLIYDVFKAIRLALRFSTILTFIADILYFLIICFMSFCFFLATTGGEIRAYILIGFIIGFFTIRFILSDIIVKILSKLIKWILKILSVSDTAINGLIDKIYAIFSSIFKKLSYFFKNIENTLKKHLKKSKVLLYTNEE